MMKKVFALVAMLALAGVAQANYWNLNWKIYDAYSPLDTTGSGSPGVMTDYNVTWSLIYGPSVAVDQDTGKLVAGSYTFIDDMDSVRDNGLTWTDTGTTATYRPDDLFALGGTTYAGSTAETTKQTVYQHIWLQNKNDANDIWYWLSDGTEVTPLEELTGAAADLGKSFTIGGEGTDADRYWTKVNATSVPEPTTMSLLGLGALAMVLRRKLRK